MKINTVFLGAFLAILFLNISAMDDEPVVPRLVLSLSDGVLLVQDRLNKELAHLFSEFLDQTDESRVPSLVSKMNNLISRGASFENISNDPRKKNTTLGRALIEYAPANYARSLEEHLEQVGAGKRLYGMLCARSITPSPRSPGCTPRGSAHASPLISPRYVQSEA